MVLVDTSVWVEIFRRPPRLVLENLVSIEEVAICLPVYQELLQGFTDEVAFRKAREALGALPIVESPLRQEIFDEAVAIYRRARRAAFSIRSSVDCLIAVCAIRHDLEVLHVDRDFDAIARVAPLRARRAV